MKSIPLFLNNHVNFIIIITFLFDGFKFCTSFEITKSNKYIFNFVIILSVFFRGDMARFQGNLVAVFTGP